jgi:hypothetical protein
MGSTRSNMFGATLLFDVKNGMNPELSPSAGERFAVNPID